MSLAKDRDFNAPLLRATIIDPDIHPNDFPKGVRFDKFKKKMKISIQQRDKKFKELMLMNEINKANLDELDRDILYMSLEKNSLAKIAEQYPQISYEALKHAKEKFN